MFDENTIAEEKKIWSNLLKSTLQYNNKKKKTRQSSTVHSQIVRTRKVYWSGKDISSNYDLELKLV